ncbi:MAG: 3-oxoacyl-[acyl-carrier-protein] reductase [Lentisphaerae bacterium]|jgi:3-oxoacyl-[acyl-carrier protein] reductase|nr:3-oxoacyl-[acyl-carrier-protein] reductase [Lentisphaerota bacterium]
MKTAVVTGSARGIGCAICEQLAIDGVDNIVVCDLNAEWCNETVEAIKALGKNAIAVEMNVADSASVEGAVAEIIEKFGKIDICVNNAGITRDGLLMRMSEDDWDSVLDINLKGAYLVTKAVTKHMMRARSGAIVNIASIVGIMGNAGQCNYSASKGGLIAFTKSCAREFAGRNIRVNAVAPGFIQSKMTDVLSDEVKSKMMANIPMNRLGQPSDVAQAVSFLAGDNSGYITGQVLSVNGGMLMP